MVDSQGIWALSLAHQQLSLVFFQKTITMGDSANAVGTWEDPRLGKVFVGEWNEGLIGWLMDANIVNLKEM